MADFQAIGALFSNPDTQAEISKITGVDTASLASAAAGNITQSDITEDAAAAPTLSEDQISQLVDALLPEAQMAPLVTENCMCTETAMNIIYGGLKSRGITDL